MLCMLPPLILSAIGVLHKNLGCPAVGDCYLKGDLQTAYVQSVFIQAMAIALVLMVWPVALYRLNRFFRGK